MAEKKRRVVGKYACPEAKRDATLTVEYHTEKGKEVIDSIQCDNPRLADLDNWDCKWSCWDKVKKKKKKKK